MHFSPVLPLALAATLCLSGCSAGALKDLVAAAAADGKTETKPGATTGNTTGDAQTGTTTKPNPTPTTTTNTKPADTSDKAKDDLFAAFEAKVLAASDDPEKVAKLFVAGFAYYSRDKDLALELMTLAAAQGEVTPDAKSRSGFTFPPARSIYWRTVDRQPTLAFVYFDDAANAETANAEDHVVIDADYKAVDKGIVGNAAAYYLKVNHESGKSSRPIRLVKEAAGWRVSNYSSLVVAL